MTSNKEDKEFAELVSEEVEIMVSNLLLGKAIEYIRDYIPPYNVYDVDVLRDYVGEHYMPEDVFSEKDLNNWAVNNGYIKEI